MSEDIKSSAHIWDTTPPSNPTHESPPAYTGIPEQTTYTPIPEPTSSIPDQLPYRSPPAAPIPRPPYDPLTAISALSHIPYRKYNISDATTSKDKTTLTVKHTLLLSQPKHLLSFILEQARLPPKPTLRIIGRRDSGVDFDLTLNLTHLLDLQTHRWRLKSAQQSPLPKESRTLYASDDPSIPKRVASAVKHFSTDRSENKSFVLTRSVNGNPTEMLAGQVRNLAAAIKYRGVLQIDFITERSQVVVHKEPSGWLLKLLGLHSEQRYDAVESVWSFGSDADESGVLSEATVGIRAGQEWWESWAGTIRNAMIRKYKGNVGVDDWMEATMGYVEATPAYDWGRDMSI